jgi:hypothetical protein
MVLKTCVRFPAEARDYSLLHTLLTGSEDHQIFYPVAIGSIYLRVKL